jgi:hypothetical protein
MNLFVVGRVGGARLCLRTATSYWHIVHLPGDIWVWRVTVECYRQGKTEEREKNCPSATLSTTNPTWIDPVRTLTSAVRGR